MSNRSNIKSVYSSTNNALIPSLGTYIRTKRLAAGLTQTQLAKFLDYTPQFITNWERGASNPPGHVLPKLVKVLKLREEEILTVLGEHSMRHWRDLVLTGKTKRGLKSG